MHPFSTPWKHQKTLWFSADLVIFTEEILNEKLEFLCSERGDYGESYKRFEF